MRSNDGFTLIEVLVALAVGSMVVLMAQRTFGAAIDLRHNLDAHRTAHDEFMESRRYLAQAFGSADAGTRGSSGFHGDPRHISFSWVGPDGLVDTDLAVRGGRLIAVTAGDTVRLARVEAMDAEFLLEPGANARWFKGWQSPASAPVAVRLILLRTDSSGRADTLLFAIGPRG